MSESTVKNIQLKSMSQLFSSAKAQTEQGGDAEKIISIPLNQLHPHPQNPYSVRRDAEMDELVELIRESGQQEAIIARPRPSGGYEIISGHRRHVALGILGMDAKVVVRDMSDFEAIIAMVDANAKRKNVSPMELANAYKMRIEAVAGKRGRPSKEAEKEVHSGQDKPGDTARKQVAKEMGVGETTIQRYTSLHNLTPELQSMVDSGDIAVVQATDIAQLKPDEQKMVYEHLSGNEIKKPNRQQARQLKLLSEEGVLTDKKIQEVFKSKVEKNSDRRVILDNAVLDKYFPLNLTPEEIQNIIVGLLEKRKTREKANPEPDKSGR